MRPTKRINFWGLLLASTLASCGGDSKDVELPPTSDSSAAAGDPLEFTTTLACALDDDCESGQICFQGLCAASSADEEDDNIPGLSVIGLPTRIRRIAAGQSEVDVTFELSGNAPAGGLPYRVERSDESGGVPEIQYASGESTITITIPTGLANPDTGEETELVHVSLVTAAGTVRQVLAPEFPSEGHYGGNLVMGTFGQLSLPVEFSIVTDPVGAALEDADSVYLVLPIIEGSLFNPLPVSDGGPTHVTRELRYEAFDNSWVAGFLMPYTLDADSTFGWTTAGANNVTRSIRFELTEGGDGTFYGRVADAWSGIFEGRTQGGVIQPEVISFTGTFDVQRIEAAPLLADVPVESFSIGAVAPLPSVTIDQCGAVDFDVSATVDGTLRGCSAITNTATFLAATASAQADCALAVSEDSLSQGTTASQIVEFLDEDTPNPGGQSFVEFMDDCATQTNGRCVPAPEVLCGRQLSASAIKVAGASAAELPFLIDVYQRATKEAFLGKGFGAFYADAQTRLDWLKASDYPATITSAVETTVAGLLEDWQSSVLDVHMTVLRGQLDSSGGAALGQDLTDFDSALERQRSLLLDTTMAWRASADAMALGAARWNTLLTGASDRDEKKVYIHENTLELYLMAGVLAELNRAAGAGAINAVFAGGFRVLLQESANLAQPYDRLLFERQGEVVVSTSLDPTAGNTLILAGLEEEALAEVAGASSAVNGIIADSEAELLNQAELTQRIANEADALEAQLTEVCGLPNGCTLPDDGDCAPRAAAGECGFVVDSNGGVLDSFPSSANPSDAGASVLAIQAALIELQRAEEAIRSHFAETQLYFQTTEAFESQLHAWNAQRSATATQIKTTLRGLQDSGDAVLVAMIANVEGQMTLRENRIAEQEAFVDNWETIRVNGAESSFKKELAILAIRTTASGLNAKSSSVDRYASQVIEGLPRVVGTSNDATYPARLSVRAYANLAIDALQTGSQAASAGANYLATSKAYKSALGQASREVLQLEDEIAAAEAEADAEYMRNQFALFDSTSASEERVVALLIEDMDRDVAVALAYERDLIELRDRSDEVMARIIENAGLHLAVQQADLAVQQAFLNYSRNVLSAQLLQSRLVTVRAQLQNINQLLGSPTAVFAWANRLTIAESRLERAKSVMMDWVVALEYFAVRPFFDSRIQILLARNTTQLELIATDLKRIQNSCGGAVNTQIVEVSVRDSLLGINRPIDSVATGETLSPAERFREVLAVARIPIDKRVRYSTDAAVGDLLNRSDILAVSFDIGMNEFANLETTCNAKLTNIAIQLVGTDLGDALPTVSLLYDGTSRLRSCQPDIENIVDLIGADATPFNEITEFHTPGRSISPVAGVNEFPTTGNESLGGLPISSQYTLLIDRQVGENLNINWDNLNDIQLRFEYGYQDLFPSGQCN